LGFRFGGKFDRGFKVFHSDSQKKGIQRAAKIIHRQLKQLTPQFGNHWVDNGIESISKLENIPFPYVLVEIGGKFPRLYHALITKPQFIDKVLGALSEGITNYMELQKMRR
jgi:hypothetical protein